MDDLVAAAIGRRRTAIEALERLDMQLRVAQHDGLDVQTIFCAPETLRLIRTEAPGAVSLGIRDSARVFGFPIQAKHGFPVGEFFLTYTTWPQQHGIEEFMLKMKYSTLGVLGLPPYMKKLITDS